MGKKIRLRLYCFQELAGNTQSCNRISYHHQLLRADSEKFTLPHHDPAEDCIKSGVKQILRPNEVGRKGLAPSVLSNRREDCIKSGVKQILRPNEVGRKGLAPSVYRTEETPKKDNSDRLILLPSLENLRADKIKKLLSPPEPPTIEPISRN
ncbi:hypothetical protein CEXT_652801 [Caerostris extrusa]|uniref:Uncharacterized protein n=1 Tax=Caerostris extrusa TaxID=172846 RepID=A0AAV4M5N6_CAEEX|nr:hypothetical protein CEXT_652801 [Caerostris extrusa]